MARRGTSQTGRTRGDPAGGRLLGALLQRGSRLIVGLGDVLAARAADNITRQYHRLDRRARFDDLDL